MKKLIAAVLVVMFASVVVFAGEGMGHGKKCGSMGMDDKKCCQMNGLDADVKLTETKEGVTITITAKKGGATVKEIQEKAKSCCMVKTAAAGSDMVTCPVMGETIQKDKAYATAVHKGETYYFCCKGCKEAFEKNPEKYIKK